MDPITISNTPETPAPVVAAAVATPVDNTAELTALRAELAQTKQATQFWADKYQASSAAPPAPVTTPVPEEEVDILDILATQGAKGFDAFMRKRGYVQQAEVDATVNAKGQQLSTEAELLANYPDLKDHSSDFFRATAANYGELRKQGVSDALAMKLGAQQAQLEGFKSGRVKTPTQVAADTAATKEAARIARVKAQSGDRTAPGRTTEGVGDEGDGDELTPEQKHICAQMGISEESYIARAKKGTQMSGLGGRK
jgi:hypothetical protein